MLNERKLTENELEQRKIALKGLLQNKRALVKKYGADAEKVMYGTATKQAKKKVEKMNLNKLKEMIANALTQPVKEQSPFVLAADAARDAGKKEFEFPKGSGKMHPVTLKTDIKAEAINTGFSGRADYGEEDKALDNEDELELKGLEEAPGSTLNLSQSDMDKLHKDGKIELDGHKILYKTNESVNENIEDFEVDDAIMELRNIVDEIEQKADEARDIVRNVFPNELSRLDGYGAFSGMYSANRYDVTLGGFVDRLEEEGYEIEDGVAYVNEEKYKRLGNREKVYLDVDGEEIVDEDLDVGHVDNEPHMIKKDLYRIAKYAAGLYKMVDRYDGQGEVDFPHWWQSKIIKAKAMMVSAKHYLDGEEKVAKIDSIIDVVDIEEGVQKSMFTFLDDLRDSGVTNMFGAAPYLQKEFGIDKKMARQVLSNYMQSLGENINIQEKEIEVDDSTEFEIPLQHLLDKHTVKGKKEGDSTSFKFNLKHLLDKHIQKAIKEKKLTTAEKNKKEDIIKGIAKQKGGKKKLEPVDYAVATDRAKKLAEKNDK